MSTKLKGINLGGFGGYSEIDQLQYNLKFWLEEALLENGAYNIFRKGQDVFLADDESTLKPAQDKRYPENTVWEGAGREWVWQINLDFASGLTPTFRPSGVWVNDIFHTKATFPHHIDFLNGRIIFENPPQSTDKVESEFVTRGVYVGFADEPEFHTLLIDALEEFLTDDTPSSTPTREHQVWMPSIFIEVISGKGRGLQLGGGQIKTRVINFHVFADNPNDRNLLLDWLDLNNRKSFFMANLNKIPFPLDQYGDAIEGIDNWKFLVANNKFRKLRVMNGTLKKINSINTKIFRGTVTWEVEIDIIGI